MSQMEIDRGVHIDRFGHMGPQPPVPWPPQALVTSLSAAAFRWRPVAGRAVDGTHDERAVLKSTLSIGKMELHVYAVEVRQHWGLCCQWAACSLGAEMLDAVRQVDGPDGPYETTQIAGREYCIFATPFAS